MPGSEAAIARPLLLSVRRKVENESLLTWTTRDQTAASELYGALSQTRVVTRYHVKMLGHDLQAALTKDRTLPSLIQFLDLHHTLDLHATWDVHQSVNALHLFRLERQLVTGLRMAIVTISLLPLSF